MKRVVGYERDIKGAVASTDFRPVPSTQKNRSPSPAIVPVKPPWSNRGEVGA